MNISLPQRMAAFLLLLVISVHAQPALEPFETALDSFEYERALQLAEQLPAGPTRTLCLAELALSSNRPERSFPLTDGLDGGQIPSSLLAKFYLVQALQEKASHSARRDLDSTATKRISALLAEGLRQPQARARDKAVLLLLDVRLAPLQRAKEAGQAISELSDVDPRFALTAQAQLASRSQQSALAATLWKALSDASLSKGELRASQLYALKYLHLQPRDDRSLAAKREIFEASLQRGDPVAAFEATWSLYGLDDKHRSDFLREAVKRMPSSFQKLEMICQAGVELPGQTERLQLARDGIALSQKLGEPILEGSFWNQVHLLEQDSAAAAAALSKAKKALLNADVRGYLGNEWLAFVPDLPELLAPPAAQQSPNAQVSEDHMEQLSLDIAQNVSRVDLGQAEETLTRYLSELEQIDPADRKPLVSSLLGTMCGLGAYPQQPHLQLTWRNAAGRALAFRLQARPEAVELILDSVLLGLRAEPKWPRARRYPLADWLVLFGRTDEAMLSMPSR